MEGFNNIYKGKKVLITGHTGFKGSWLSIWLHELGAEVIGYALDPYTKKDNFVLSGVGSKIIDIRGDIRDVNNLNRTFKKYRPEFVFHLAAQPLVRLSYKRPVDTYEVNVMGTINVLEAIKETNSVRVGLFVTTDKCYENKEQIWGYRETDKLGGYDPYSSSKACAEIAINSWRSSFLSEKSSKKAVASVRAGNVIGGGDWAKDRLIPDCIKAIEKNDQMVIRNPYSIRPWQHVLEPINGYLMLGEKMYVDPFNYSEAWNFGPNLESLVTVKELCDKLIINYGSGKISFGNDPNLLHEAKLLNLDITKSILRLGWKPKFNIDECVEMVIKWYKCYQKKDIYNLCVEQINKIMDR